VILTLSNPIFLPTTYSPALIYFGRERGWWITCNYPMVLKEKNINMNSPDDFLIYFRLHKIIKVFLFIFVYKFFECDQKYLKKMETRENILEEWGSVWPFFIKIVN